MVSFVPEIVSLITSRAGYLRMHLLNDYFRLYSYVNVYIRMRKGELRVFTSYR